MTHPIKNLLDVVASGHVVSDKDIDDLRLAAGVDRAAVKRTILATAEGCQAYLSFGDKAKSRELAARSEPTSSGLSGTRQIGTKTSQTIPAASLL